MFTKKDYEEYVKQNYPRAVDLDWFETKFGKELLFYRDKYAYEPYTCIEKNGQLIILTEF